MSASASAYLFRGEGVGGCACGEGMEKVEVVFE
jgi:hypothetical protein